MSLADPVRQAPVDDFQARVRNPAAFYADPEAILADAGLGRGQRLALLEEWAHHILDARMTEDDWPGQTVHGDDSGEGLLRRVNSCVLAVEACPAPRPPLLLRLWRQMVDG